MGHDLLFLSLFYLITIFPTTLCTMTTRLIGVSSLGYANNENIYHSSQTRLKSYNLITYIALDSQILWPKILTQIPSSVFRVQIYF